MIAQILRVWPVPTGHIGLGAQPTPATAPTVTVDLAQLVSSGWLEAGVKLRSGSSAHAEAEAAVAQDGRVYLGGTAFDTPSGAARSLTLGEVNGWIFWRIDDSDKTLADIRSDYLSSLGEADTEVIDEVSAEAGQTLPDFDEAEES